MVAIGRFNTLKVVEKTRHGFLLGDGRDRVFLDYQYAPADLAIDQSLRVFVYSSGPDLPAATTATPKVVLGEFGYLRCVDVTEHGAFVDWGMPKDLFVPFAEQHTRMEAGRSYVVAVGWDERGQRLMASSKLGPYFDYDLSDLQVGDSLSLLVFGHNASGAQVVIDQRHVGLIYTDATTRPLHVGDELTGYAARIREDNRVDVVLTPPGGVHNAEVRDQVQQEILHALQEAGGFLPLHDKSSPADIARLLGISKKVFKRSAGTLYKERRIRIAEDGIYLVTDDTL